MKKQIITLVLLASLFKQTFTMEAEICHDMVVENTYDNSYVQDMKSLIYKIFEDIQDRIYEQDLSKLLPFYAELVKIISSVNFEFSDARDIQIELIEYSRQLNAELVSKADAQNSEIFTNRLIRLVKANILNNGDAKSLFIKLILLGANPNAEVSYNDIPMTILPYLTGKNMGIDLIPFLLICCVNPNDKGGNKNTLPPLVSAAWGNNIKLVKQLISFGANIDGKERFSSDKFFDKEILDMLINHGFAIDSLDNINLVINPILALKYFLKNGGNINRQDKDGKTILYIATELYNAECIELLLKHGAKDLPVKATDHYPEHTAYTYIKWFKNSSQSTLVNRISQIFEKYESLDIKGMDLGH